MMMTTIYNRALLLCAALIFLSPLFSLAKEQKEIGVVADEISRTAAELGVVDAPATREERDPDRVVLQYIQGQVYRWNEFDVQSRDGESSQFYITVERPFQKALNAQEAEILLKASMAWQDEIADASDTTRNVFGSDDRVPVSAFQVTGFPFNNITFSETRFTNPAVEFIVCTGFLVTPYVGLTSADNAYQPQFRQTAFRMRFTPGVTFEDNDQIRPYGNKDANVIDVLPEYLNSPEPRFSCARFAFDEEYENIYTYLPIVAGIKPSEVTTAGYSFETPGQYDSTMYTGKGIVLEPNNIQTTIKHLVDQRDGGSGSPLWASNILGNRVVGIHSRSGNNENLGFYFRDDETLDTIEQWMLYEPAGPPAPFNDLFANPYNFSAIKGGDNFTNAGTTNAEVGEPNHGDLSVPPNNSSIWFRYEAPLNGTLFISTNGSGFDSVMAAYSGTQVDALSLIAFDDDSGIGSAAQLEIEVQQGSFTNFVVAGYNNQTGDVRVNWELVPADLRDVDDAFEDNDTVDSASFISNPSELLTGLVLADDDWYIFPIQPLSNMTFEIESTFGGGNVNAQLYDRRGAFPGEDFAVEVASGYSPEGRERLSFINTTGATELYLRVYGERGETNKSYFINPTVFDVDDNLEGDNDLSCGTLPMLSLNRSYRDLILRDDDWYQVIVDGVNELTVLVDHVYFSGDLDVMITEKTDSCNPYDGILAIGNSHDPNVEESVTVDVSNHDVVFIRVYGEQRQKNFYDLILSAN
jgi:V8-like Glu-specific endopeptidase